MDVFPYYPFRLKIVLAKISPATEMHMSPGKSRPHSIPGDEALYVVKNLAENALRSGDRESAWQHLKSVTGRLNDFPPSPEFIPKTPVFSPSNSFHTR